MIIKFSSPLLINNLDIVDESINDQVIYTNFRCRHRIQFSRHNHQFPKSKVLYYQASSTPLHKTVFTELGNYLTAFRHCNSRGRKMVRGRKGEKRQSVAAKKRRPRTWTIRNSSEQLDFYLRGGYGQKSGKN